ncbi:MAG TPA: DM13 domain-containing protein [Actinomycetota bacterium]|nr:DM13 domain-containing protein [Actinomycetota bacterium]
MGLRASFARHRRLVLAGGAAAAALLVFVLAFFQPQKLFIDQVVDETPPPKSTPGPVGTGPASAPVASGPPPAEATPAPALPSGTFRSLAHQSKGRAVVVPGDGGSRTLRFEDFSTDNGPDLRVYLSATTDYDADFVELGRLKGNKGAQNYDLPGSVDLSRHRYAVVWCKRFSVGFAVAELA